MRKLFKRALLLGVVVLLGYWLAHVPQGVGLVIVWGFLLYVVWRAWPAMRRDFGRLRPNSLRGRHGGMWVGSRGGDTL